MRRKDREVKELREVVEILRRCDTVRIGMFHGDYPYVVPVSFGMEETGEGVALYFHGTAMGERGMCIRENPHVCIEADIFYKVELTGVGITARYESVIGFGVAEELEGEEKLYGLKKLVEHYGYPDYPLDRCKGLDHTAVYRVEIKQLTGKRNLPDPM